MHKRSLAEPLLFAECSSDLDKAMGKIRLSLDPIKDCACALKEITKQENHKVLFCVLHVVHLTIVQLPWLIRRFTVHTGLKDTIFSFITKTSLFKYTENFTTKK